MALGFLWWLEDGAGMRVPVQGLYGSHSLNFLWAPKEGACRFSTSLVRFGLMQGGVAKLESRQQQSKMVSYSVL